MHILKRISLTLITILSFLFFTSGILFAEQNSYWRKHCSRAQQHGYKKVCLTIQERAFFNKRVIISAATRKIAGRSKQDFLVSVPLGYNQAPGILIWIDKKKTIIMKFVTCNRKSCTAVAPLKPSFLEKLKKGKKMTVSLFTLQGKVIGYNLPLQGFTKAYDGTLTKVKVKKTIKRSVPERNFNHDTAFGLFAKD